MSNNQLTVTTNTRSALNTLAGKLDCDPSKLLSALKETAFKGATDAEMMTLTVVANQYGLNPFLKELYAFPAKGGGIVPIVSIDGWISIVNQHPSFDGMEITVASDGSEATCKIYRKDRTHPTIVTEYLEECQGNTQPWKQFPKRMLRHKALIQCARVAFGFSGIMDDEEGRSISEVRDVTPKATVRTEPINPFADLPAPKPKEETERQPEPVQEAQPEPAAEPKPKLEQEPPAEQFRALVSESGIKPKHVLTALIEMKALKEGQKLEDLDEKRILTMLEVWEQIESKARDIEITATEQEGGLI